jgi:hypothetical protein
MGNWSRSFKAPVVNWFVAGWKVKFLQILSLKSEH